MTLSVIGAGFGRTGTESMKHALEILGLGPCHHMYEVITESRADARLWRSIAQGNEAELGRGLRRLPGLASDWPSAYFWRELSEYYPDCKNVCLTVRDARRAGTRAWRRPSSGPSEESTDLRFARRNRANRRAGVRWPSSTIAITPFLSSRKILPMFSPGIRRSDRLLTYTSSVTAGRSLCRFLNKPIPDTPYPRTNSTDEFNTNVAQSNRDGQR